MISTREPEKGATLNRIGAKFTHGKKVENYGNITPTRNEKSSWKRQQQKPEETRYIWAVFLLAGFWGMTRGMLSIIRNSRRGGLSNLVVDT